jgi:hypothetical protein
MPQNVIERFPRLFGSPSEFFFTFTFFFQLLAECSVDLGNKTD